MATNVGRGNVSVLCLFVVEMAGKSERFGLRRQRTRC